MSCNLTKEQIEVLLEVTAKSYLIYDTCLYKDTGLQEAYNQNVKDFNDKLDEIRIELKRVYYEKN